MKSLEIWSEIKDEASTIGKTDFDASVFLNAYIDPYETLGSALSFKLSKDLACDDNGEGFSQDYLFRELDNIFADDEILSGVVSEKLLYVVAMKRVYYPFFGIDSKNLSAS